MNSRVLSLQLLFSIKRVVSPIFSRFFFVKVIRFIIRQYYVLSSRTVCDDHPTFDQVDGSYSINTGNFTFSGYRIVAVKES